MERPEAEPEDEEHDDDDDVEEDDNDEEAVSLGFARPPDEPAKLLRNHFPSKLGGPPAWLDPVCLPLESDELRCEASGERLRFLLQLYAPLDEGDDTPAFHRMLYLFISPKGSRLTQPGAVRAFRCQLPRRNEHYPYEPPLDMDEPMQLDAAAAATALQRCRGFATDTASSGEAAEGGEKPPPCYTEHELVVEPEPEPEEGATAASSDVSRLLSDYQSKVRDEVETLGEAAEPDLSFFGAKDRAVDGFADFSARVSRAPAQCIRYTFSHEATPLWAGKDHQRSAADVPKCERCGAARRFEFQVMPQAITYLGVDSAEEEAPDFATIAVYTCSASCRALRPFASDGGLEELTGEESVGVARSAVGQRCVLSGLAARPELNGKFCHVLHWHSPSGRWAVECEKPADAQAAEGGEGERLRVRSANLRVVRSTAARTLERDGGYAEEYVWVQPH